MNQSLKKLLSIATLVSASGLHADVAPLYSTRSQGVDAARELAGWTQHVNLFDMDKAYGTFAITTEYSRSFRPQDINKCLFDSCNDCHTVVVSGSRTSNRGATDWLADYFYLPTDFRSTLQFKPVIDNVIVDLNMYMGLDEWVNGMFFRLHLPIVYTRWNLDFCESTSLNGTLAHEAGYFSASPIERTDLLANFSAFAAGRAPQVDGTTFIPLKYAKFDGCAHAQTRLAELQAVLGWNFLQDEDYHLGLGVRFAAPTGNKPEAELLFEPIAGNGRHWELGAQFTSHAMLWRSEDEESSIGFFLDANITHLFNATQYRTFDVKGKPLSRYMLAEKLGENTDTLQGGGDQQVLANAQFKNVFTPVANLSTFKVDVKCNVQADIAAQFTYANGGLNWDLGYDFWYRSCEKFDTKCSKCPSLFAENTWALKGDAYVVGFVTDDGNGGGINLSATESQANIHAGTNFPGTGIGNDATALAADRVNPRIDNAQLAFTNGTNLNAQPNGQGQTRTSIQPIFLTECDFNKVGVIGLSNKIYTHLSYQWVDHEDWVPYIGVGGFAEFGSPYGSGSNCSSSSSSCNTASSLDCESSCNGSNNSCASSCNSCCDSCVKCAVSQWGVWLKGGVSFN